MTASHRLFFIIIILSKIKKKGTVSIFSLDNAQDGEGLGDYHRRIGADAIIHHLKENHATGDLMTKPFNTDCVLDGQ